MTEPDISLYDKYDYDYSSYWENRTYEHEAEAIALNKMLSRQTGNWMVDIGGSFGRHVPQYYQRFHNCIIADYSIKALKQAREELKKKKIGNVYTIAANAYNLPFKESVFDGALMIRVMHHLEEPENALSEVSRILAPNGVFVLEAANKIHLKALIRAFFTLKWGYVFSQKPVDIYPEYSEGTHRREAGIMKNYHPKNIKKLLVSQRTKIRRSIGISFFRIPTLKRIVPHSILVRVERVFQSLFGWLPLTPSILYEIYSSKTISGSSSSVHSELEEILVCPKCKGELARSSGKYICNPCSLTFSKKDGILDFRYPLVT